MTGEAEGAEDVAGYYQDLGGSQKNIFFSTEASEKCYADNLIQETNELPVPLVKYISGDLTCAFGEVNLEYFNPSCARRYALQTFLFRLPSIGPANTSVSYDEFIMNFCQCSITEVVLPLFSVVQNGAANSCEETNRTIQTLNYTIGSDGSLILQSQNGFLYNQMSSPPLDDYIQRCFNTAYDQYNEEVQEQKQEKVKKTILFLSSGSLSIGIIIGLAASALYYRREVIDKIHLLKERIRGTHPVTPETDEQEFAALET